MRNSNWLKGLLVAGAAVLLTSTTALVVAQNPAAPAPGQLREPVYRVPTTPAAPNNGAVQLAGGAPVGPGAQQGVIQVQDQQPVAQPAAVASNNAQQPAEHPLMPSIRHAQQMIEKYDKEIQDYSCTLIKRERVDGELLPHEYIFLKVRQKPFSVYMYFLGPKKLEGNEVIYWDGQNQNKIVAHAGKGAEALFGTLELDPTGRIAMRGNRYPITEIGIRTMLVRLIEVGTEDSKYGECSVTNFDNTKINGRDCSCLQVVHPVPRKNFRFHIARIYNDKELDLPIRFESYAWPAEAGAQPELLEEYTYTNLKLNNGFTDKEFDRRNPDYKFK